MGRPDTDSKKEMMSYAIGCILKQVLLEEDSYVDHFQLHPHELKQACDILALSSDHYLDMVTEVELNIDVS